MEFYDIGLTLAFIVFGAGVIRRASHWFCLRSSGSFSFTFAGAARALIADVLLLFRTLRTSPLRWAAHCLVFFGFMGLLLFHAMDDTVTAAFFPNYEPTLDPWQFLRNLFGAITLVGLVLMVLRRVMQEKLRTLTRFQDWAALLVVGCIILSGFLLEASKIISPVVFDDMVYEYFVAEEGRDLTALKAYWTKEYGAVFPETLPMDADTLEHGRELDEESCADCHSNTASAFVSRPLSMLLTPIAPALDVSRAHEVFWSFHVLFCFIALAALPFGKFFHPISTPLNLLVRQGRRDGAPMSGRARKVALDACTRCGECSLHCSVAPVFSVLGNENILPSEKLLSLRKHAAGEPLSDEVLKAFAEGSRICTECMRCTDICPSGINLQDLWLSSKAELAEAAPEPDRAVRGMSPDKWTSCLVEAEGVKDILPPVSGLADNAESFWACVQCTTCTSVCPVVAVSEDSTRDLDLAPQQIMNLLRMGLKDQAIGARMVWSCTTCYKCQEHCPQNIRVADVLYELRNTAAARLRAADNPCEDKGDLS